MCTSRSSSTTETSGEDVQEDVQGDVRPVKNFFMSVLAALRLFRSRSEPVGLTDEMLVRLDHLPREIFFGYPVPEGETVADDYVETCLCGETYPCSTIRALDEQ